MSRLAIFIVLATCLFTLPTSASAASYVWDEATGTLAMTASTDDGGVRVRAGNTPGTIQACGDETPGACPDRTGLRTVAITLAKPGQSVALSSQYMLANGVDELKVQVLNPIATDMQYRCSQPGESPQYPCHITGKGSALDINDDGDADITFNGGPLDKLRIETGSGNDTVDLTQFTYPIQPTRIKGDYEIDVDAGAGNDTIRTGATRDNIDGGKGNDSISLGVGNDGATGGGGNNKIVGGPGDDVIVDVAGNDIVNGGAGSDFIKIITGNAHVVAGPGNDTVSHHTGTMWVDLGPGNDYAEHIKGPFTGFGGPGKDYLRINTLHTAGFTARIDCGSCYDELPVAYPHRTNCEHILTNHPVGHTN